MSDADKTVHCDEHGETPAAFVCRHLLRGRSCGFHDEHEGLEDDEHDGDPWPDAWCDLCDAIVTRDGEWIDENSPDMGLVCTHCYEVVRHHNQHVPEPIREGQLSTNEDEYAALSIAAYEWCKEQRDRAIDQWAFDSKANWYFDADTRVMRGYDEDGGDAVLADVTVVGSFSTRTNTWAWVWGNSAYSESERAEIDPVRVFGEVRGIQRLSDDYWDADEVAAWEMAQLAAYLLGADAVYRAPYDNMHVFMLLRNFGLAS